jgi:DNA-binding MarR family transcriptional regulator
MADRGLVKKEKCDSDRRGAFVALTKQGRRAIEAAAPGHVDIVRHLFIDKVTPFELDVISLVAERVLASFDQASLRPVQPED